MNQQLLNYINHARQSGMTDEQIKGELIKQGWDAKDIIPLLNIDADIPPELALGQSSMDQDSFVRKWSWGGFFLTWIYFLASRAYKTAVLYFLGMFVPILNIVLWIRGGLKGRKIVLKKVGWPNFEAYKKRQRLLDKIGVIIFVVALVIGVVGGVLEAALGTEDDTQSSLPQPQQEEVATTPEESHSPQPLNCGTIRATAFEEETPLGMLPGAENEAAGCWEGKLSQCNPAYIDWTEEAKTARLEILGRGGADMCVVSQQDFYNGRTTTCDIPIALIEELAKASKQEGELVFRIGLMLAFEAEYIDDTELYPEMHLDCTQ